MFCANLQLYWLSGQIPKVRSLFASLPLYIQKKRKTFIFLFGFVRVKGLEPPRLSALDPKSSAATNYATHANPSAKVRIIPELQNFLHIFFFNLPLICILDSLRITKKCFNFFVY